MDKNVLINDIKILSNNVQTNNIVGLIDSINTLRLDKNVSPVVRFACDIMIDEIKSHILKENITCLRVSRKAEYNIDTADIYTIKDGVLYRNGRDTKWSSFGKLYQAYKYIHKLI